MKVLMISTDRTLFGAGSSGDVVERHKKYANMAGSLDIIVFAPKGFEPMALGENLRFFPTKSSKVFHFKAAYKLASKLMAENKYDLLVTQELAAPAGKKIKAKFGLPWIVSIHSMFFSSEWLKINPVNWYMLYRIKKAIKKADAFRAVNGEIETKLRQWGVGKPILVQPTAVNIKKFQIPNSKSQIKSKFQIPNSKISILYVGRLSKEKNIGMLINAFKGLTGDLELQIVGEGKEKDGLKQLAQGDSRIKFLGSKTHDELVDIYGAADIFVLPSNTESFGKVLIEAAAAGCVLVATKTAGAKSIITDGQNGLLVDVGDEVLMVSALERLVGDEALRQKLSLGAQNMAEQYDAKKSASNFINFWRQIVESVYKV